MSNHDCSMEMRVNNHVSEVLSLIAFIRERALYAARNGWEKEREPEPIIETAALELIDTFGKFMPMLFELDNAFDKYADLVDAIDLWVGNDAGPDGVEKAWRKMQDARARI